MNLNFLAAAAILARKAQQSTKPQPAQAERRKYPPLQANAHRPYMDKNRVPTALIGMFEDRETERQRSACADMWRRALRRK
ncbi:hypothetical protein [Mesorhizobium xinjiangense]|uniref:hypothetical protein n=1 Tax=Mesorhizobium xinjiangense TaxID=2678685 RepID=UPI0012EEC2F6|nr:hypothetical protein [Mesorhizobium xinjiangense]